MQRFRIAALAALALAWGSSPSFAQELYRDQMSSGAGWGLNASSLDYIATFGYDYSADAIPEAPNSRVGDTATSGLKMQANLVDGAYSVFTVYPIGQSFSGDYMLRFDAWMNYDADERINGGSNGTTEFLGGGIGYDDSSADIGPGAQVLATGDGGSGSDWRAFAEGAFLDAAEMTGLSRNGTDLYYADFLPGVAPPAGQVAQTAFPAGTAGSPGFQWITFEIRSEGGVASVFIERPDTARLEIAEFNGDGLRPYTSDGNISLVYADFFSSISPAPAIMFGLIDNVVVSQINPVLAPPPAPPPAAPGSGSGSATVEEIPALGPLGPALVALLTALSGALGVRRKQRLHPD